MEDAKPGYKRIAACLLILSLMGGAALSSAIGHDANWDLRNYHLYNPYMVFHDRWSVDHNVAGFQTYLNPMLDMLTTYPLLRFFGAAGNSLVLGAIHGLNFFFLVLIALELLKNFEFIGFKCSLFLAILAAALGMSGALAASEIGTCFGDLTLSPLNLGGLWLALKAFAAGEDKNRVLFIAGCGVMIGSSIGFKLVNGIYGVAIVIAVAFQRGQGRPKALGALIACLIAGMVITHGWWSLFLFRHYQNPVFPLFNGIFHSPYFDLTNYQDPRYFANGWAQHLLYPFFFSWQHQTAQIPFQDFRFPLAYICVFIIIVSSAVSVVHKQRFFKKINPSIIFLITFIAVAYIVWQPVFSIQRYLITIELLLPILILLTCLAFLRKVGILAFIFIGLFLVASTEVPSWGRVDFAEGAFNKVTLNNPAAYIRDAVIILGDKPLGYLVPTFDLRDTIWLGEPFSSLDQKDAMGKLTSQLDAKEAFVVSRYWNADRANRVLRRYGMPATAGDNCLVFTTQVRPAMLLCSAVPSTNLQIVRLYRPWTIPSTWTGFSAQEDGGVWTEGTEVKMVFKLNQPVARDLVMTINGKALVTNSHRQRLSVAVNGHQVATQVLTAMSPIPTPVSIPAEILGTDETVVVVMNLPDAAAPQKLGTGDDGRLLGLSLRWVALHHADRPLSLDAIK